VGGGKGGRCVAERVDTLYEEVLEGGARQAAAEQRAHQPTRQNAEEHGTSALPGQP